ncbi:MAG: hypothetical protein GOV15_02360, partial [Candidatus Diapherotrites archaeon]|nr:hypothetical protein [Candidatus Diapherotrites archaeon]
MDKDVKKWLSQVERVKAGDFDLSHDEDLSIALMNLISLEEHFYFTAMKTDDMSYLDLLESVRSIRKELLKEIVVDPKGEEWCISKHLLATSMRLMEVGTKELSKKKVERANSFFKKAFDLYSLFFAINLKLITPKKAAKSINIDLNETTVKNSSEKVTAVVEASAVTASGDGLLSKFSELVKKAVDCC